MKRLGTLLAFLFAGMAAYIGYLRPWHLRWGATDAEVKMSMPGDDIKPKPWGAGPGSRLQARKCYPLEATRAITINAPASAIWPWLVQIGEGRGGFYSYAWLESLGAQPKASVDTILEEHQHLKLGDPIQLHAYTAPRSVAVLEEERALVVGDSWAFVLRPITKTKTRLVVRNSGAFGPGWINFIFWRMIFEPINFIMERQMLIGVKERAELTPFEREDPNELSTEEEILEAFRAAFTPG